LQLFLESSKMNSEEDEERLEIFNITMENDCIDTQSNNRGYLSDDETLFSTNIEEELFDAEQYQSDKNNQIDPIKRIRKKKLKEGRRGEKLPNQVFVDKIFSNIKSYIEVKINRFIDENYQSNFVTSEEAKNIFDGKSIFK
jgi:hypothetical protein